MRAAARRGPCARPGSGTAGTLTATRQAETAAAGERIARHGGRLARQQQPGTAAGLALPATRNTGHAWRYSWSCGNIVAVPRIAPQPTLDPNVHRPEEQQSSITWHVRRCRGGDGRRRIDDAKGHAPPRSPPAGQHSRNGPTCSVSSPQPTRRPALVERADVPRSLPAVLPQASTQGTGRRPAFPPQPQSSRIWAPALPDGRR